MGTTTDFIKLRAKTNPKVGQWNYDYKKAVALAKKEGKILVALWTNGDKCGLCVTAEKCLMNATFKDWMAKQDAYFVMQYSGDANQGKEVHDWVYKDRVISFYPGFRITLFGAKKNPIDVWVDGSDLRNKKTGAAGAKAMVAYLEKVFAKQPKPEPQPEPEPVPETKFKIRFNEKLTVAQCNKIFDAIDNKDGYCPCQPKSEASKCHCKDFLENKKIDEPCICKLFVKQPLTGSEKISAKKSAARAKRAAKNGVKVIDVSKVDSTVGMTFMYCPHGPARRGK